MIKTIADSKGKGTLGCLVSLAVLAIGIFVGMKIVPLYYAAVDFETDLKTEVSRAGSHFYDDEMVIKDILALARKSEVDIKPEDIKLQRVAGQINVTVDWSVPVNFMLFEHTFQFNAKATSFIGRL